MVDKIGSIKNAPEGIEEPITQLLALPAELEIIQSDGLEKSLDQRSTRFENAAGAVADF